MRLHALLLLLCSLDVADAGAHTCDISYIQGFAPSEMYWTGPASIRCRSDDEWMMYTENGKKKLASYLSCRTRVFWKAGGTGPALDSMDGIETTIRVTDTITVSCIDKVCHELWTLGEGVKRDNNKLTCSNPYEELQIDNDPTKYDDITCAKDVGWTTGESQAQIKKDIDEFDVKCVQKPCHELMLTLGEGVKRDNNQLTCTNSDEGLQIDDNDQTLYNNLTCTKNVGWTTGESQTKIKEDIDKFGVKCEKKPSANAQNGDNTAVYASVGAVSALLLIAGIIAIVVFMRKRRNAPELKQEHTKEAAKSKDAPSSGAPSPSSGAPSPTVSPSPSGGVPSSN